MRGSAGPQPSSSHLVLIPSFNPGPRGLETVRAARAQWDPVWVVDDGSTDGTTARLLEMAASDPGLTVLVRSRNGGKGAAVLEGVRRAGRQGFTHVLTLDADGQHPTELIPRFMARSQAEPDAMVLGVPRFGTEAPRIRVAGRRVSNFWANLETLWSGIDDSLFGFRVYPLEPLRSVMERSRFMRRFDFDVEAAVRLRWRGIRALSESAPVRYFRPEDGGVSHFRYGRDNLLLTGMHLRLFAGFLLRLPWLLVRRAAVGRWGAFV